MWSTIASAGRMYVYLLRMYVVSDQPLHRSDVLVYSTMGGCDHGGRRPWRLFAPSFPALVLLLTSSSPSSIVRRLIFVVPKDGWKEIVIPSSLLSLALESYYGSKIPTTTRILLLYIHTALPDLFIFCRRRPEKSEPDFHRSRPTHWLTWLTVTMACVSWASTSTS